MTNNTDTLVAFAATSGATRFWTGTDDAGKLAQFWTKQPNAADYPGLRIESHITVRVVDGKEAAALAASPAPAEPCDQCNGRGYMVSDGEYDGKCHCGAHFMDKAPAAPAPAAPVAESQPADERDRFETWLRAAGRLHESDLGHGKVFLDEQKAEVLWQAFQAGAALSAPAAAPVAADAGWKENTGDEPLFPVDLEFRDGEIRKGENAGSYYWHLTGQGGDIVRWRLSPVSTDNQQEEQSRD